MLGLKLTILKMNGYMSHLSILSIVGQWLLLLPIGLGLPSNVSGWVSTYQVKENASLTRPCLAIHRHTKPGGWVEFVDLDMNLYSNDGSLSDDNPLSKWNKNILKAARMMGREPNPGPLLSGFLQDAGFASVKEQIYSLPVGTWAKDNSLVRASSLQ